MYKNDNRLIFYDRNLLVNANLCTFGEILNKNKTDNTLIIKFYVIMSFLTFRSQAIENFYQLIIKMLNMP